MIDIYIDLYYNTHTYICICVCVYTVCCTIQFCHVYMGEGAYLTPTKPSAPRHVKTLSEIGEIRLTLIYYLLFSLGFILILTLRNLRTENMSAASSILHDVSSGDLVCYVSARLSTDWFPAFFLLLC